MICILYPVCRSQKPFLLSLGLKLFQETEDNGIPWDLKIIILSLFIFLELCVISSNDYIYLAYMSKEQNLFELGDLDGIIRTQDMERGLMGLGSTIETLLLKIWSICSQPHLKLFLEISCTVDSFL